MNNLFNAINDLLAEWDPIEVGKDIAITEYSAYVPDIIQHSKNEVELMEYLKHILINNMGLSYKEDEYHNITVSICRRILKLILNH